MEFRVSKIGAAVDQLDWAIRLFLDHKAYVPAITLAGAAEEMIGELLSDQSTFALLKKDLAEEYLLPEKIISQDYLNKAKNWLKHWQGLRDDDTICLKLETEAMQYIVRGLANLITHDRSLPSQGPRFLHWLSSNRKDLYDF